MDHAAEVLNDKDRRLYQYCREGLSPAEISQKTGQTPAAVSSALTRMYAKLREELPSI
jgi:DNA-binding CsgD family transcriptional regulator